MRKLWYHAVHRLIASFYFSRIQLLNPENVPGSGPVLYLGLHRNGAVDGFVYRRVLRNPVFMISTQLRRNWFARLFFCGIAVQRQQDHGDQGDNDAALAECLAHLRSGGELFVFPEGTSSLGPRHLPFRSGAVWLIAEYLKTSGPTLQVVPLGIHYECPWAFRSKVEVVAGKPISIDLPLGAGQLEQIRTLKRRMTAALEDVGFNVATTEHQALAHRVAYAATLGTARSYFRSLKAVEKGVPNGLAAAWKPIESTLTQRHLLAHQGVPLFPMGPGIFYLLASIVTAPIVGSAMLLNLPPLAAGWLAARRLADDRNVISLWKILVGAPAFLVWFAMATGLLIGIGQWFGLFVYLLLTALGLGVYYRFKKLSVAVWNGMRHPELRAPLLRLRQSILDSLPDEAH